MTVGDAGNTADDTGYGSVAYDYHIGKYEVTNRQYTAFLNAVAKTDTHDLYNPKMDSDAVNGGITQEGSTGNFSYSTKTSKADKPVNYVSFWDAARFANWITNGKPLGAQGPGTTEDGMYNLGGETNPDNGTPNPDSSTVERQLDFSAGEDGVAVASEDEWYKAAYFDGNGGYYTYPIEKPSWYNFSYDPIASYPTSDQFSANYDGYHYLGDGPGAVTEVGAYTNSGSSYGTFDQGGNVWEWIDPGNVYSTGFRGGSFDSAVKPLLSSHRRSDDPADESRNRGFRITSLAPITPIVTFSFQSQAGHGGTVSPTGTAKYRSGTATYLSGTELTVTATPDAGYVFESWSGSVSSTDPQITVTLDQDHDITATFVPDQRDPDSDGLTNYQENLIPTVSVGDAGNSDDDTGYGAVAYEYHIGKYEVTNSQYAAFLNAVAKTDTHSLYNPKMGTDDYYGGISRSGSSGNYSYSVRKDMHDKPVNYVSFWDAARFANWLTSGQPTGSQDRGTTEDGAYDLTSDGINNNTVKRGQWFDADVGNTSRETVFAVASEDEWYKAAYFDGNGGYYDYPTQSSNYAPSAVNPATHALASKKGTNAANYENATGGLMTEVGTYKNSRSHYGTFDQAGNVWEWTDEIISTLYRGIRGGSSKSYNGLQSSYRTRLDPAAEFDTFGFRVTSLAPIVSPFSLQSQSGSGGTVSPTGTATYPAESKITVTATPDAGYLFDSWSGSVSGTDPQITVTLDQDHDITATFIQDQRDPDSDDLSNYEESTYGSDPNEADTSGDGLNDGVVANAGFDPTTPLSSADFTTLISSGQLAVDSNKNGLTDSFENAPNPATLNNLGYYTLQSLTDGRPGSITISANDQGGVTLELQIQRSDDLVEWSSDPADRIQIPLTLSGDKEFFRFAIPE